MVAPRDVLLRAALAGAVAHDSAEDGQAALCPDASAAAFHAALAAVLAEGLIRDPVRIEPGALHCRWVLELTPSGREAARRLPPAACPPAD